MGLQLVQTPLHDWHAAHGARLVDFGGWSMPLQYTSIMAEHRATRGAAGMFDVSHMGRLTFSGEGSAEFLDRICTRRVVDMPPGRIRYSLICNHGGDVLDDVLVYRVPGIDESDYQMVVNASNREKILAWLNQQSAELGHDAIAINDHTERTAMIAVQGPVAVSLVDAMCDDDVVSIKYYHGQMSRVAGHRALLARTGYTGEDGCELVVAAEVATELWQHILGSGESHGAVPAGLGCRDTLRLEAAMPLYGHELTEQINPVQAGLRFAYNLKDREFIGREAIERFEVDPNQSQRVGLCLEGKRVARQGSAVFVAGEQVGEVTSGTFSPTLERSLAMAYVTREAAAAETELTVDVRGTKHIAKLVDLPFYQRP